MWPTSNLGVNCLLAVFFFLVSHPSDEKTLCRQPAPCGQTAPWSNPYSSHCGQPAPLVLTGYKAVFFFLRVTLLMRKSMRPARTLWPDNTLVSSLLIPVQPASTLGVNCVHGGVLSCESPLWWRNYMRPVSTLWPDSTLVSSLLTRVWPASTFGVNCLHCGVLLSCESP